MLNTVITGDASDRPPLVIAHGLFGSARNWGVLARRLGTDRQVIAVDMRNHGQSPRFRTNGYAEMADDLADVIAAHGGRADVLGHSMGGKAAMVLALGRPELVARLIVADIAPVGYGHSQTPLIRAMKGLDLDAVTTRRDADAALEQAIPEPPVRAFLLQSLDLKGERPRWLINLDVLEAETDAIIGFPDVAGRFDGPALFLAGGASDYVQAAHEDRIRALFPAAKLEWIEGAGHWLHAEKPREFEAEIRAFLD
ncbi:alpha/beta hydrolase [Maritimibacter sp. 55A14]|uniref:alpha/beta fold hydrolase n=1 Tax=Maritimibacter sp. 55A14 TaxID=2174844 RepID=UPI000D615BF3|nr:alpha/beta fold hydrolase [Maritimibacter sp. 55A14]PWE30517.1 alpha/beta hydrolase [Maritimibacter sp. 55A14]